MLLQPAAFEFLPNFTGNADACPTDVQRLRLYPRWADWQNRPCENQPRFSGFLDDKAQFSVPDELALTYNFVTFIRESATNEPYQPSQAKPSQAKLQFRKLTSLAAALVTGFSVCAPQASIADDSAAALRSNASLPDLGDPSAQASTTTVRPGSSGITIESNFDRQKVVIAPEYSDQTGLSVGVALASMLGEQAAVGVLLNVGADKKEWLINAGYRLDERQRFVVTAGQLEQFLDYAFLSGSENVGMTQRSGALSYQLQLGSEFLRFLEVNGYVAKTDSRDLADKTFAVDSATLFELWSDPRRIAGGSVTGLQGKMGFSPISGSLVTASLGHERLSYDLFSGKNSTNRFTGGLEWQQQLPNHYTLRVAADTFASQDRYKIGLERALASGEGGRHNIGISLLSVHGRDGLGDDNQIQLTYSYVFGAGSRQNSAQAATAAGAQAQAQQTNTARSAQASSRLLDQVALRPGFIPSHVVAKIDTTALPTRLIAIDKAALPTASSIDGATGDITTPLGLAVTGIASVTRNGVAFANASQFALAGNNLITRPSQITQPAVGVVDTYVVTVNNAGGGTTLVTVLVSRGSVKIDSIVITAGVAPDTSAPVTTSAPSVSGTTTTATTLSVAINENGTGYYLVQAAGAAAPTVAAVLAGTAFAMTAHVPATPSITGLAPATSYKIYFVAEDAAHNVQSAVQAVDASTAALANTPPTASDFTVTAGFGIDEKTIDMTPHVSDLETPIEQLTLVIKSFIVDFIVDTTQWPLVSFKSRNPLYAGDNLITYTVRDKGSLESEIKLITLLDF